MTISPSTPLRWGILGLGSIANQFAIGLKALPDARLVAVGSRSQDKADQFGAKYDAPHRHASYEALANDPEVDVVYVATPHPMHGEDALLCLNAGKAVLCEKPFTVNVAEAERVVGLAREKNLFLMEAMWTRFFPLMYRVRELVASGAIGEARMIQADFGFRAGFDPNSRAFSPALGGGGLLDVGVYTISLASMLFGTPNQVTGLAHLGETGVDEQAGLVLAYDSGRLAVLSTGVRINTPQSAVILGTDGRITIHSPWWKPSAMTVSAGGKTEDVTLPFESNGYQFEALEVARCLVAGKTESEIMPLDESLQIMRTMDALRAQWGLKYPME
jgi:predicted dehydrogenase